MKEDLLKELKELGYHPSGRKVRADTGQSHNYERTTTVPRSDKGKPREQYSKTSPAYCKKIFMTYISAHTNKDGTGDDLIRDVNLLFPPNITNFYKKIVVNKYQYRSSQKRKNHPEELRWNWYFAGYNETKDKVWEKRICDWYFIIPEDIPLWTYKEWAFSYVTQIGGHLNKQVQFPITLYYDEFAKGSYGLIEYNKKGDIEWSSLDF